MTRSTSSLGLSKNNQRSTRTSKSGSSSSSRSHSPKPSKSPTINFYSFNPINRDLNDILRNFVDELCDVFIEAQTVVIIVNFTSSKDQELSQIFDWLLSNTHKDKYKTLLGYFYDQGVATKRNQRKAYCLYLSAAKKGYPIAEDLLGDCYYSGQGTTRDPIYWYKMSADNGHEVAKQRVQSLLNLISHHPQIEDSLSSKSVDM
ncbi:11813_t:CDS:2, partial [Gigaspora rosea]